MDRDWAELGDSHRALQILVAADNSAVDIGIWPQEQEEDVLRRLVRFAICYLKSPGCANRIHWHASSWGTSQRTLLLN